MAFTVVIVTTAAVMARPKIGRLNSILFAPIAKLPFPNSRVVIEDRPVFDLASFTADSSILGYYLNFGFGPVGAL